MAERDMNKFVKDGIVRVEGGTKVATERGVFSIETIVLLVLGGKKYIAYLRQPGEPGFYGKMILDRVEICVNTNKYYDEIVPGKLCSIGAVMKISGFLVKEGLL